MLKTLLSMTKLGRVRLVVGSLLSVAVLGTATGQNNSDRSPYSRFGYGSLSSQATAGSRAMGGLSQGLRDGLTINPGNPASYTAVDSLTFIMDLGLSARLSRLSEGNSADNRLLGNLEYATLIFPLSKRMAMSAGIMPLATTGYTFGSYATMGGDTNDTQYLRSYSGSGSYNNLYLGIAGRVLGGLHLGVNASYLFGHTEHQRKVIYTTATALNPVYNSRLHLRGFKVDLGAQYELKLDTASMRSIVVGATLTPGYSFRSEQTILRQNITSSAVVETLQNDTIRGGNYTMPLSVGFGASYRIANKLMVGADVQYRKWTQAKYDALEATFQDQWKVILGGEWTPDYRARSPWRRAKYRLGLSAGNSYLQVPSPSGALADYTELGASLGISFPLVDRRSAVNFSLEYKHLQPRVSGMVKEQYIGATIGIVFNESWFRQARVH